MHMSMERQKISVSVKFVVNPSEESDSIEYFALFARQ